MGICAYCENDRPLCKSHSIPDGIFRPILQNSGGQAIAIPQDDRKIHRSQETGAAEILCEECENDFNRRFDQPLISDLRKWHNSIIKNGLGVRYNTEPNQIAQALSSIFWRASISDHRLYDAASVNSADLAKLLSIFDGNQEDALKLCSLVINRIYDATYDGDKGFSNEAIAGIIIPVVAHDIYSGKRRNKKHFGFSVLMQGFLFGLTIPRIMHKDRQNPAYLKAGKMNQFAPKMHFLDYPPLKQLGISALSKIENGEVTSSVNRTDAN